MSSSHEKLQEDRRRRRLNNIIWLLGLLVFAVAIVAGWRHIHRPDFAFGDIVIHGSKQFTPGKILEMAGSRRDCLGRQPGSEQRLIQGTR